MASRRLPHLFLTVALLAPSLPALVRDGDQASVEVAILDVLLERGIIDQATYAELSALAQRQRETEHELDLLEGQLQRLRAPDVETKGGKAGKLQFASEDGTWTMGIKGRIQVQADVERGQGDDNRAADKNNLSVKRARLAFEGQAGGEGLTYKLEIDAATQSSTGSGAKDATLTDGWLNWKIHELLDVKAGQAKFPFGREIQATTSATNLVDRSHSSATFSPNREPLIMAYGTAGDDGLLEWYTAVSNGELQGVANQDGQDGTGSTGMRQGVRVVLNPMGKVAKDMAAFQTAKEGGVKLALGASWMENEDQPFDGDGDGTAGDARSNDTSLGYEAQLLAGPLSFLTEKYQRDVDTDATQDVNDTGYNVQAGVLLGADSGYEVVLRRSVVDLDLGDQTVENTLGFNIYVDKHNSKWSFDLTDVENTTTPDKDRIRARAQYQLVF